MCLGKVISVRQEDCPGEGWKVVQVYHDDDPASDFSNGNGRIRGLIMEQEIVVGEKLMRRFDVSDDIRPREVLFDNGGKEYPTGFHAFLNRQDAEDYREGAPDERNKGWHNCIARVRYERILARGKQSDRDCVVTEDQCVIEVFTPAEWDEPVTADNQPAE